jgi:hypothetical protein
MAMHAAGLQPLQCIHWKGWDHQLMCDVPADHGQLWLVTKRSHYPPLLVGFFIIGPCILAYHVPHKVIMQAWVEASASAPWALCLLVVSCCWGWGLAEFPTGCRVPQRLVARALAHALALVVIKLLRPLCWSAPL